MNIKRYLIATIVLFAFMFCYESYIHGVLLMNLYNETPNIWRNYTEMKTYITFNTSIMVLLSVWITFIFTRLFKDGGWQNGLRFGIYFGILSGIQAAGAYFYLPISAELATAWFTVYVVESVIGGMLIGAIYHK